MEKEKSKLHSIEISRGKWVLIVWTPIILGVIAFAIFNSTFFIPRDSLRWALYGSCGGMLIGFGFGLVCARIFKIEGIDN